MYSNALWFPGSHPPRYHGYLIGCLKADYVWIQASGTKLPEAARRGRERERGREGEREREREREGGERERERE